MNSLARSETIEQRRRIFSGLAVRNRVVGVLRFAVPAAGIVIFGGLVLQLFLGSLGDDFGFSNMSIDRNNLIVDTPSYSSMGADGSSYLVEAAAAKSALDRTDIIDLTKAVLTIKKTEGTTMTAHADAARLETTSQLVTVDGATRIADSEGMKGTIVGIFANMAAETMVGKGDVDLAFANGATLKAASMSYDGSSSTWRFARATLTLPATPGEDETAKASTMVSKAAGPAAEIATGGVALPPVVAAPRPMARRPLAQEKP
jgi:lipopolysaccharide export system protein LptC